MTIIGIALIGVTYILIGGLIARAVVENHYNMESFVVETILCLLLWPLLVMLALGMRVVRQRREKEDNQNVSKT